MTYIELPIRCLEDQMLSSSTGSVAPCPCIAVSLDGEQKVTFVKGRTRIISYFQRGLHHWIEDHLLLKI